MSLGLSCGVSDSSTRTFVCCGCLPYSPAFPIIHIAHSSIHVDCLVGHDEIIYVRECISYVAAHHEVVSIETQMPGNTTPTVKERTVLGDCVASNFKSRLRATVWGHRQEELQEVHAKGVDTLMPHDMPRARAQLMTCVDDSAHWMLDGMCNLLECAGL